MRCNVYKWRGHKYDTPLHNSALDTVNVIKKCRCGKTKDEIRYVPLPDTEEYELYNKRGRELVIAESDDLPFGLSKLTFFIIAGIVSITVTLSLLPSIFKSLSADNLSTEPIGGPSAITFLIPLVVGVTIVIYLLKIFGFGRDEY